jgi:hypothetical protein
MSSLAALPLTVPWKAQSPRPSPGQNSFGSACEL